MYSRARPDKTSSPSPLGYNDDGMLSPGAALSNHDENSNTRLEGFLKYLIERGLVDNEDDSSETIHRFLEIFERFEGDEDISGSPERQNEYSTDEFETRSIFTLADFFKSLGPNEYYDIAQKIFN